MRSALYTIMEFETPDNNYMVLESIKSAPAKVVHVFDLSFDNFKVGRSVETDMKIADISVSRTHSFLTLRDGRLYVEDNGSKFGTLVKIQRPQALLRAVDFDTRSIICQIGRTLVYFELQT
jgi:pSer/pThr/pTyr-binding forkhead associated (FHA) protein